MKRQISITVNREQYLLEIGSQRTLIDVLREDIGLTGTKEGCGLGTCGACTVIVDGEPALACLTLAVAVDGAQITTIEGLARDGQLHPLQEAFAAHGAVQCGFCTPGMIMSSKALLDRNPNPSEKDIRTAIAGNLCRCTGYYKIVEAVQGAIETTK